MKKVKQKNLGKTMLPRFVYRTPAVLPCQRSTSQNKIWCNHEKVIFKEGLCRYHSLTFPQTFAI